MTSIADTSVKIQATSQPNPSTPSWFGEMVIISKSLQKHGALAKITEQVRFARKRFGHDEVIDFLAVLFGSAISGERTLETFYQRLQPFANPFMALFERERLPSRAALSRFLAAFTETSRIERETFGWSLMSMGREKPPGNAPYLRRMNFLRLFADWMTCVRQAERGPQAGGGREDTDNGVAGAQFSMARQFREPGRRAISGRTASGPCRHSAVSHRVSTSARADTAPPQWPIWQRSCAR